MTKPIIDSGSRMRDARDVHSGMPHACSQHLRSSNRASGVVCGCVACCLKRVYRPGADGASADSGNIAKRWRTLGGGQPVFRAGEPFHSISVICSGSVKTVVSYGDGRKQVTGFQIAGELLGTSALGTKHHPCTAIALEPTTLCELPVGRWQYLGEQDPSLQHDLFALLGHQIAWDYQLLVSALGKKNAAQRIAAFIVNTWRRYAERGVDGCILPLLMSRIDIGSYLGLSTVTLGQILTIFERQGLITLGRRCITLRVPEQLLDIADLADSWRNPPTGSGGGVVDLTGFGLRLSRRERGVS